MSGWEAISIEKHLEAGWEKYKNFSFAAKDPVCMVAAMEIPYILGTVPLAFIRRNEKYVLAAVQSLKLEHNTCVDTEGRWLTSYIPAHYRSYPFQMTRHPQKPDQAVLYADLESGLFHVPAKDSDTPLFNADGKHSEDMQKVLDYLMQTLQSKIVTQKLVDQLEQFGLIQPWEIKMNISVKGLYRINEPKLQKLEPEGLSQLAGSGALAVAYGQIFSQAHLGKIVDRQNMQVDKGAVEDDMFRF